MVKRKHKKIFSGNLLDEVEILHQFSKVGNLDNHGPLSVASPNNTALIGTKSMPKWSVALSGKCQKTGGT